MILGTSSPPGSPSCGADGADDDLWGAAVRLLDLFCGAGGAAMGYSRAGFTDIVGVDITPQKHYPFTFVQGDALEYLAEHGGEFDVIHASPPCQGYSRTRHLPWLRGKRHPLLIPAVRAALQASGKPYVIENVGDAPLRGVVLCGEMFGLPYRRLRVFESNMLLLAPDRGRAPLGVPGSLFGARLAKQHRQVGINSQAIPPAYTEFIGRQLR